MKTIKRWSTLFLMSCIVSMCISGCHEKKPIQDSSNPSGTELNTVTSHDSMYNESYELYNEITDLGVVITSPSEKELSSIKTVETYSSEQNGRDSILIIPKYNGSKIIVSKVEYTGERYIPKETIYTEENTPADYGLLLKTNCTEGIPRNIVTVSYQNKSCEYLVVYDGKNGDDAVTYLRVGAEAIEGEEGDLIAPIQDDTYLEGLNLFSSYEVDLDQDGENEKVEVYCQGDISPTGEYIMDDGEQWAMVVKKGDTIYPIFERNYIQLGGLEYTVYVDYDDYERVHIIVTYKSGASLIYYDCTYDTETQKMKRVEFYEAGNINKLKDWQQLY